MNLDTIFSGMATAESKTRGEYFEGGLYTLEVVSLKYQNGFKGLSFIAKFKVLAANNGASPGVTRDWIVKLDNPKNKGRAMGDIKNLVFALQGIARPPTVEKDPKAHETAVQLFKCAVDDEYAKANNAPAGLFVGHAVSLEATVVTTPATAERPNGGTFTRMAWSPAEAVAQAA